jgi:hypothetical protein
VIARLSVAAMALALASCGGGSGNSQQTADADGPPAVTQERLYDIAKKGNDVEFAMAWDQAPNKDVDMPDPRTGQSLIHYAASNRLSPLMIHTVLEKGADPNRKDAAGLTPLRHAIMANNQVAIRNLANRVQWRVDAAAARDPAAARVVAVRTDIPGPEGKTDDQTCQDILAAGTVHRGCQVLFEMENGGPARSTPEQVGGVLNDLGQARRQSGLQ